MSLGPASHGLRRALVVDDVRIDVALDGCDCRERSWRLGVGVSRGLANVVPARLDPVFRRRLARHHPAATPTLGGIGLATGKVAVVCAQLQAGPRRLWAVDAGSTPAGEGLRLRGSLSRPQQLDLAGGRGPDRATTGLLLIAVGPDDEVVAALTAGLQVLERLCGGESVGWMTWTLSRRRIVVPLKAMRR